MVPSTKINLLEDLSLYYQVYCQEVPSTKITSLENLKIDENFQNYGIMCRIEGQVIVSICYS